MKPTLHIYTRVSTAAQEKGGTSLASQKELGKAKAQQLGFDAKIWDEGGKSSHHEDLENRPVLRELLRAIEDGLVSHLWTYNNDRLSRNDVTQQTIKLALQRHNVRLYTKDGEFDLNNPQDKLFKIVLDGLSQYDNDLRADRSRRGKLQRIKQGYWRGGAPPFGYAIEEKRLVENKEESKWVRKIFKWAADKKPIKWIKLELDTKGIEPRRKVGLWSLGSIQAILKNPAYKGSYKFTDKRLGETIECKCPQIVPEQLWDKVQEIRKKNSERKSQNNRTKRFYLLRNLMFCDHCGRPMAGRIKESKNERLYYCPNRERRWKTEPLDESEKWSRELGCGMSRSLNIPRTDKLVWDAFVEVMSNSQFMEKRFKARFGSEEQLQSSIDAERKKQARLRKRLNAIKDAFSEVTTASLLKDIDAEAFEKIQEKLKAEQKSVKRQLNQSQVNIEQIGKDINWVGSLARYKSMLDKIDTGSEEKKKALLELFIEKILVRYLPEEKQHELTLKFKLPLIELDDSDESEDGRAMRLTSPLTGLLHNGGIG